MADDDKQTRDDFHDAVNMTASELEKWLDSDESKSVGQKNGGSGESTGHESGREIVDLLGKEVHDLTEDDLSQMKRVHGYVSRHLRQKPHKTRDELAETPWRYSLMNWGHDPLK